MSFILTPFKLVLIRIAFDFVRGEVTQPNDAAKRHFCQYLEQQMASNSSSPREQSLAAVCRTLRTLFEQNDDDSQQGRARAYCQTLVRRLRAVSSPDVLFDFVHQATNTLFAEHSQSPLSVFEGPSALALVSVLGVFQRQASLAFVRLSFEAAARFFERLRAYVAAVDDAAFEAIFSAAADDAVAAGADALAVERDALDAHARQLLSAIESGVGDLSFDECARDIAALQRRAPRLASLQYLAFVNCLVRRRYDAALDQLHRYFDAFVPAAFSASGESDDGGGGGARNSGSSVAAQRGSALAFASLMLTRVHFAFGNSVAAREALAETLRIAQERGSDSACLAHAMWWMARLQRVANGRVAADRALRRCHGAARSLQVHELAALVDLELAEAHADVALAPLFATPWMAPAARAALEHSGRATNSAMASARHLFRASLLQDTHGLGLHAPLAALTAANVWRAHGRAQLARTSTRVALCLATQNRSIVSADTRIATLGPRDTRASTDAPLAVPPAPIVDAMLEATRAVTAQVFDEQGYSAGSSFHAETRAVLGITEDAVVVGSSAQRAERVAVRARLRYAQNCGQRTLARECLRQLTALSAGDARQQLACVNEQARLELHDMRLCSAHAGAQRARAQHARDRQGGDGAAHFLTLIDVHERAGDWTGALRVTLHALATASNGASYRLLCEAKLRLARVLVHLGHESRALALANRLRIGAARLDDALLLSRVDLLRAQCQLALGECSDASLPQLLDKVQLALAVFLQTGETQAQCDALQVLARLCDRAGDKKSRNRFAKEFIAAERARQQLCQQAR